MLVAATIEIKKFQRNFPTVLFENKANMSEKNPIWKKPKDYGGIKDNFRAFRRETDFSYGSFSYKILNTLGGCFSGNPVMEDLFGRPAYSGKQYL